MSLIWIVLDNLRVAAWMWLGVCICVGESCKSGLMLLHFSNKNLQFQRNANSLIRPSAGDSLWWAEDPWRYCFMTISLSLSPAYGCWYFIYRITEIKHSQSKQNLITAQILMFTSFTWTKILIFSMSSTVCVFQGTHRGEYCLFICFYYQYHF